MFLGECEDLHLALGGESLAKDRRQDLVYLDIDRKFRILAGPIVEKASLRVLEHVVSGCDIGKDTRVAALVRVMLDSFSPISSFDLVGSRVLVHAQCFVVIARHRFLKPCGWRAVSKWIFVRMAAPTT